MAATLIMSSGTAPRDRSLHGRANPWTIGPTALAPASRCTSLYAMLPASSEGKMSTFADPATGLPGDFRAATTGIAPGADWTRYLVPSDFHSSRPWMPSSAAKKSRFPTTVRAPGWEEDGPGAGQPTDPPRRRRFDAAVMAGNVMIFVVPGSEARLEVVVP